MPYVTIVLSHSFYSTPFKTQEINFDKRSKEIGKERSVREVQTKQRGDVTLSTELQSSVLTFTFLAASTYIVKFILQLTA